MNNDLVWEGMPCGLFSRLLNNMGISSTVYQIIGDELILKIGFFNRNTSVIKLSNLSEPKLVESLYQRLIKVGTIYLKNIENNKIVVLKNLKEPEKVRQLFNKLLEQNIIDNEKNS